MADLKELQDLYRDLELARLKTFDLISTEIGQQRVLNGEEHIMGVPGGSAQWDGRVLKFNIPDCPPPNSAFDDRRLYAATRTHWRSMMLNLYKTLSLNLTFEKVHCHIAVFLPLKAPWDTDNRTYKFIIDGLRSCRIIPDDSFRYLEFSVSGYYDRDNPRTEVFVTEQENIAVYKLLNSNF